jgi:glycosyltransferase involved in cell wall biosynthesis
LAIDLSNTIEAPSISGVQRVALGLTGALRDQWPVVVLDGRAGSLSPADSLALARLRRLEEGHSGVSIAGRVETRLRRLLGRRSLRHDRGVQPGDVFIDLEPSWHAPQARSVLLPDLVRRDIGTAALLPDVLPLTNPEWFPPASVERFTSWFEAHLAADSTLLAISNATADRVAERSTHRPSVIRIGAEAPPEHRSSPAGHHGLLMLGTVEPRKGHSLLLDALDLLGPMAPVVDVVGRPGWASADLLDRLADHPKVRWHQHASDDEVAQLWDLTGLLLQPTLGEGYGLPVVEALQRGIAVAASDIPVMREAGRGQAHHLPPDPTAWAAIIADFAHDPGAWPQPALLDWPTWGDGAHDVLDALRTAGRWPDHDPTSR